MRANFGLATVIAFGLLFGAQAQAGRRPSDYQEPARMTDAELEAAKLRSRYNVNQFGTGMDQKPRDFPWMLVGLAGLALLAAAPFAFRAFVETTKQISSGHPPRDRSPDQDDEPA